jgi:hypothetical protein
MTLITSLGRYKRYSVVVKEAPDGTSKIERLAANLEPDLQKAVLDALNAQQAGIDLDALADAIASGDKQSVLDLLHVDPYELAAGDIGATLTTGVVAAGVATANQIAPQLPSLTEARFTFGSLNPTLVNHLQTYQLNLIRQVNDNTVAGVRQVLTDAMIAGENPKQAAVAIKQIVGLTEKQAQAVMNFRQQLEKIHLGGGGTWGIGNKIDRVNGSQVIRLDDEGNPKDGINARRLRDFRYDGKLKSAIANGKALSQADIDKMVDGYARKYLKHRSLVIARTEAMRATNMGVQDAWRQAIDGGKVSADLVRRFWIVARDERLCQWCAPVPRMNGPRGVKMDQMFQTPMGEVRMGPLHPQCRCTIFIQLFERSQLEQYASDES